MPHSWPITLFILFSLLSPSWAAQPMNSTPPEHAVIVHFTYGSTNLQPLFALEDKMEQAIAAADVGEFDGDEIAIDGSDGSLYMYGPDADKLFEIVRPLLESEKFMHGAKAIKRYGPPEAGVHETTVIIAP